VDASGALVLCDQGPIGRPGTARPIQACTTDPLLPSQKRHQDPTVRAGSTASEGAQPRPLDHHARLVADGVAVVLRCEVVNLVGPELKHRAVLEQHAEPTPADDPGDPTKPDGLVWSSEVLGPDGWPPAVVRTSREAGSSLLGLRRPGVAMGWSSKMARGIARAILLIDRG
jgi:hypothetical protein